MSSALDLAGVLRSSAPDDLVRLLSARLLRASSVNDAFDLADTLLDPSSVRDALSHLDRTELLVLHAAWRMDTEGKRAARQDISMIKVVAAQMHQEVLDRAMQVHGALGMSDDTPLAAMWRQGRWLRIADGPDEVHKMVIALRELNRFKPREPVEA